MQKKLLALAASVAMVLSMFAGVAFAADTPANTQINSDTTVLVHAAYTDEEAKTGAHTATVTGTLTTTDGARVKDDIIWSIGSQAGVIPASANGVFSITVDVSDLTVDAENELTLTPVNTALYNAPDEGHTIVVRNQAKFDAPEITYNSGETVPVFGYLVDARGKAVDATGLKLATLTNVDEALAEGDVQAATVFADSPATNNAGDAAAENGIFRFSLNADATLHAGPRYLVMPAVDATTDTATGDYIVYGQINVDPIELTVEATPAAAIKGVEQDFSFKAYYVDAADVEQGKTADARFRLTGLTLDNLVTSDGAAPVFTEITYAPAGATNQNGHRIFEITNPKVSDPANVKVYATLKADATVATEPTNDNIASIDVVVPDSNATITLNPTSEIKVTAISNVVVAGDLEGAATDYTAYPEYKGVTTIATATAGNINVIGLPEELTVIEHADETKDQAVRVLYGAGGEFDEVTIKATGANMEWEETYSVEDSENTSNITIPFAPQVAGEVKVEVTATKGSSTYSFSQSIPVKGYSVSISPAEVNVDEVVDFTITVTDADGKPVNNATAKLVKPDNVTNLDVIENSDYRNNGVYVHEEFEVDTVGGYDLKVLAADGTTVMAYLVDAVTAVGEHAYDVTADADALLLGQKQKVTFHVQTLNDENVLNLADSAFTLYGIEEDGSKTKLGAPAAVTDLGKGNYSFDVLVDNADYVALLVRVATNGGKDMGELELQVVKPVVSLNADVVTEALWQELTVQVIDPRTDEALLVPFTLVNNSLTVDLRDMNDEDLNSNNFDAAEETSFQVRAQSSDAKDADNYFSFTVKLDADVEADVELGVQPMQIAVSPEAIVMGQHTAITVTATDHQDNPVADKAVRVGGQVVGETDENGQLSYSLLKNDTAAVLVEVATDVEDIFAETTVSVDVDTEAPVIDELPTTVDNDKLTITVTDNVKVTRLVINNEEIVIVPQATVTHTLQLQEGANDIRIVALDAFGNGVEKTFTVNYQKPAPVEAGIRFVVGKSNYTNLANGEQAQMVAAYKQGNHTMVAVRMLQDLGAKFAWNQATRTATFTLNDKVVQVTQDSTTATVNGQAVKMPVAPRNLNGRIMVPVRFISENLGLFVHWQPGDIITIK